MSPQRLRELLERVRSGDTDVTGALEELRMLPYRDLGEATVDHHRALRQGTPEVVFGEGKSVEQIALILAEMDRAGHSVLVTRLAADKAAALAPRCPELRYAPA